MDAQQSDNGPSGVSPAEHDAVKQKLEASESELIEVRTQLTSLRQQHADATADASARVKELEEQVAALAATAAAASATAAATDSASAGAGGAGAGKAAASVPLTTPDGKPTVGDAVWPMGVTHAPHFEAINLRCVCNRYPHCRCRLQDPPHLSSLVAGG